MKKNENNIQPQDNYIYVVLVKALTGLGKFARLTGKYEYTHIAVCLDENFDKFYTFSRRKHSAPFDCGYMVETMDCYAFGEHKDVKLKIFKLPVTLENKRKIVKYINTISKDSDYVFNFYSMLTMSILHGFRIYKAHNCMSFVGKIISLSKSVKMTKPYYKYNIQEMDELLTKYTYKEEFFKKSKVETKGYMESVGIIQNAIHFIRLNSILIYRLIKGRKRN